MINNKPEFKVIIAGSRGFTDYKLLEDLLDRKFSKVTDTHKVVIVSGTAKGADKLGELYAKNKGYPVHPFPADWHLHGKSAGYKRNKRMAQYADALVAFYDGSSKGTGHMINLAKDYISEPMNIHVHVYKTQPQLELFSSTGAIK